MKIDSYILYGSRFYINTNAEKIISLCSIYSFLPAPILTTAICRFEIGIIETWKIYAVFISKDARGLCDCCRHIAAQPLVHPIRFMFLLPVPQNKCSGLKHLPSVVWQRCLHSSFLLSFAIPLSKVKLNLPTCALNCFVTLVTPSKSIPKKIGTHTLFSTQRRHNVLV